MCIPTTAVAVVFRLRLSPEMPPGRVLLDSLSLGSCFIASYDFQIGQRSFIFVLFESLPIFLLSCFILPMKLCFISLYLLLSFSFKCRIGWRGWGSQANNEDSIVSEPGKYIPSPVSSAPTISNAPNHICIAGPLKTPQRPRAHVCGQIHLGSSVPLPCQL